MTRLFVRNDKIVELSLVLQSLSILELSWYWLFRSKAHFLKIFPNKTCHISFSEYLWIISSTLTFMKFFKALAKKPLFWNPIKWIFLNYLLIIGIPQAYKGLTKLKQKWCISKSLSTMFHLRSWVPPLPRATNFLHLLPETFYCKINRCT